MRSQYWRAESVFGVALLGAWLLKWRLHGHDREVSAADPGAESAGVPEYADQPGDGKGVSGHAEACFREALPGVGNEGLARGDFGKPRRASRRALRGSAAHAVR